MRPDPVFIALTIEPSCKNRQLWNYGQISSLVVAKKQKTIFVAMSGGVDSSVAAALLKKQGFDAVGVFMRCVNLDGCADKDAEDARRVAEHLGIPFYVFDFENEYRREVVDYMIEGYRKGVTPNPDVMCNKEIKFGLFLENALALGADGIATGHYVRLAKSAGKPILKAARDRKKDQSYFLWTLTPEVLKHCCFPVGDYTKPEVRRMAKRFGLPTAEKKDSQGICFLGKVPLRDFLRAHIPERTGTILATDGTKVGEHRGAWFYTVGQRHIGAVNRRTGAGESKPLYVVEKNVKSNTLIVAKGDDDPALRRKEIKLTGVNLIGSRHSDILKNVGMLSVMARVRYRQPLAEATLSRTRRGYALAFRTPQKFIAAGQSAVFYSARGEVLGGGVIA